MFKKVLAAVLAASSVMAMSGVAMAAKGKTGNGKSHGNFKISAKSGQRKSGKKKSERKVMRLKKIKKNTVAKTTSVDPITSAVMSLEDAYAALENTQNILSEENCNNGFVLKITGAIESLKSNGKTLIFQNWSEEKKSKLLDALIKWAKSDKVTVKLDIVRAISNLAEETFLFGNCLREKNSDLIDALLAACANNNEKVKLKAAWAFSCLIDNGFVRDKNSDNVSKLREILIKDEKTGKIKVERITRVAPSPYSGNPVLEQLAGRPRSFLDPTKVEPFFTMDSMDIKDSEDIDNNEKGKLGYETDHFEENDDDSDSGSDSYSGSYSI